MGFFPGGNHMIVTADRSYVHTDAQLIAMDRARMLPLAAEKRKSQARQAGLEKRLKQLGKNGPKEEIVGINDQLQQAKQEVQRFSGAIQACSLWKKPCQYPYALTVPATSYNGTTTSDTKSLLRLVLSAEVPLALWWLFRSLRPVNSRY